ncbi:MAG: AAA family ATPase [Streptosporangiales bacterium]|nr:AAA family ATPase [Streptosporangiales bacterium]
MSSAAHAQEDDDLRQEQRYLATARDCLARMRAHVLSLHADAGDAVSQAYLDAALYYRAEALKDDPDTPLFFGRIDHREPRGVYYVGRRHVTDDRGDPVVVDWRADISRAFYQASAAEPMNLSLRRRFGFTRGALTAYEDEPFDDSRAGHESSRILQEEIERPRVGPMRDIVATIQPDQDLIVRAGLGETICVQGAPGTGKTAVGLHRAAYLLYAFRERLERSGVLVVGPNHAFLGYIKNVLPALGELDVTQQTLDGLLGGVRVRGVDAPAVARLKGDARLAEVLRRAVRSHVREPEEGFVLTRGSRRWRIPSYELADILDELRRRDVRYDAARRMLAQRVAHVVLTRMEQAGESPDDRVQASVARSKPVRDLVDALWPKVKPAAVVFRLLSDAAFLAECADGVLTTDEQRLLLWERPPRSAGTTRWSLADAALVDEAADLVERTPSLGHVVLDEAQDLSPMQLRAVGRRCSTGSATVLGDIAQGTTAWATGSWPEALTHLGKRDAHVEELTMGYRVPHQIIDFATRLLPHLAPDLAPARSARTSPGALDVHAVATEKLPGTVVDACRRSLADEGSVGLIVADARVRGLGRTLTRAGLAHHVLGDDDTAEQRLSLVPASFAKGLEFDRVVVVEPAEIVAAEPRGLHRLYVVLTRAVSTLTVVHTEPLPEPLAV